MIRYRIDVLAYLRKCGYTQFRLKKDRLLPSGLLDKLRSWDTDISLKTLDTLCKLTELSIDDLIEYVPDEQEFRH